MSAPANTPYHATALARPYRGTCGLCRGAARLTGCDADILEQVCAPCLEVLRAAERVLVAGARLRQPAAAEITALHLRTGRG